MIFQSLREGHLDQPVFMYLTFLLVNLVGSLQLQDVMQDGLSTLLQSLMDALRDNPGKVGGLLEALKRMYVEYDGDFSSMPPKDLLDFGRQLILMRDHVADVAQRSKEVAKSLEKIVDADL